MVQEDAYKQLKPVLDNLDPHIRDNRYLRKVNAELNGDSVSPRPDHNNDGAAETEAKELMEAFVPNDEERVEELKFKKSFEEMVSLAAELLAENKEWRKRND